MSILNNNTRRPQTNSRHSPLWWKGKNLMNSCMIFLLSKCVWLWLYATPYLGNSIRYNDKKPHLHNARHTYSPSIKFMWTILKNCIYFAWISKSNETKASGSSSFRVLHNNTINDFSILPKIPLQRLLRRLPGKTPNKHFPTKEKNNAHQN